MGFFAGGYVSAAQWREAARSTEILFYEDGINTTLSVDRDANYRYYRSNGKTDASTHPADMAVQVLIGQIPMMLHPAPRDVFVLGLGTGVSAAAVARYPVRSIDIVDIEPAGREAARFFEPENRSVLADRRVRYINADGRNALLAHRRSYDVIISDPSDVWVAGVGSLFTKEFYEVARSRLRPGGVMGQWWHTHALHPDQMKLIVATLPQRLPVCLVLASQPRGRRHGGRHRIPCDGTTPPCAPSSSPFPGWRTTSGRSGSGIRSRSSRPSCWKARISGSSSRECAGSTPMTIPVIEFHAPRYLYRGTAEINDEVVQRPQSSPSPP